MLAGRLSGRERVPGERERAKKEKQKGDLQQAPVRAEVDLLDDEGYDTLLRPTAAFSTLGLQWSNIQWLVAALSVGLGFGLQEIVANFISGIILLFERPIRVGDVVTVGDVSGTVTRIRIRATTIRDFEQKELLIPNKELITGRLLNWTLSDAVTRVFLTVGVTYGSDVEKAMALILEAAVENPLVLQDPEPLMHHGEIVWRNGEPVGEVRAASYGHTLGGAVGLAFVHGDPADKAFIESGEWEVEVGARRYPATVSLRPMYDPAMQRVRA